MIGELLYQLHRHFRVVMAIGAVASLAAFGVLGDATLSWLTAA